MIPLISSFYRFFPLRASLGLLLAVAVAFGQGTPATAQTATMNPPGTAGPNVGNTIEKFFIRHGAGTTAVEGAGTTAVEGFALGSALKKSIGDAVAVYGVFQTIKLFSFGKTMEYFIEDARDTNSKDEYTNDVADIQAGLRKHWLTGSLVVGNEITANMHSHPAQAGKLCQLMSDVGITPAPSVAAQIGCKGGNGSNTDDKCAKILSQINDHVSTMKTKYSEMLNDEHNLYKYARSVNPGGPLKGYGTWDGHVGSYRGLRTGLLNLIDQAEFMGCKVPAEAYEWAQKPPPTEPH